MRRRTGRLMLAALGLMATTAFAADDGYFLSWSQKGQLIGLGRIRDAQGNWYDVRICPGYQDPATSGWRNLKEAGGNLGEYFGGEKYEDCYEESHDCLRWAFTDSFWRFGLKGSGLAWGRHFGHANDAWKHRAFGWWLAYPTALVSSIVEDAGRLVFGTAGLALGTAGGVAVVPAYHLANSSVKAAWNGGVEGCAFPVCGFAWNTVVSPPLSMIGQRPSPERTDGFWVRQVVPPVPPRPAPTAEDVAHLVWWAQAAARVADQSHERREQIEQTFQARSKALDEERERLKKATEAERQAATEQERDRIRSLRMAPEYGDHAEGLRKGGWTPDQLHRHQQAVLDALNREPGMTAERAEFILQVLEQHLKDVAP